jgi:hypothetical protein
MFVQRLHQAGTFCTMSPKLFFVFITWFIHSMYANFKLLEFSLCGQIVLIKIRNRIYELESTSLFDDFLLYFHQ